MITIFILTFSFLSYQVITTYDQNPVLSFSANPSGAGNTIKINPDQSMIAAGFQDGQVKIFDLRSNQICSVAASAPGNSAIVQVLWSANYGIISLDGDGDVAIISTQCSITKQFLFPNTAKRIAVYETQIDGTAVSRFAVNLQTTIEEYDIDSQNQTLSFTTNSSQTVLQIIYAQNDDGVFLLASTDNSYLRVFSIQDGTQTQNSIELVSPIYKMVKTDIYSGQVVMGLTESNQLYRFTKIANPTTIGPFSNSNANSITICPVSKQIASSQKLSSTLQVFIFSGYYQQTLTGINGIPQQLDCSQKYLVSIDNTSFIQIYVQSQFKKYIIGIIVGIIVGLVVLIAGGIAFIKLKAKYIAWKQAQQTNKKSSKYQQRNNTQLSKAESRNMLNNTLNTMATQYN